ncbi:lysylphosphatidylglycerol synthase transmembrane domain-containing protein [Pararhizobium mangrovi]|uniref:lysylphosphatidylglycerol synthase transmembrane domain-containing protein n=1 Tax=Pararhizobium mangrovi TaxID=2590452 RepID=UPI0015E8558A|nr:lysylphosphatidylglycerol synthase transmembrane domain-containing protein [Pararhizobium mangrovi]
MKKLIGLVVSACILAVLYAFVDIDGIVRAARSADPVWLAFGIAWVVPLALLTAWRFTLLVVDGIGFLEANRLILAASTLNMVLPSKLGDLAKSEVLVRRHGFRPGVAFAIVVLEKMLDMMSLLVWGVLGLIEVGTDHPAMLVFLVPVGGLCLLLLLVILPLSFMPFLLATFGRWMPTRLRRLVTGFEAGWREASAWFWHRPRRAIATIALSLGIWAGHLFQFWLFAHALHAHVPLLKNAAFATLSILVGLLPFTFAGIGTRDAALVFFYAGYLTPAAAALLGILATLRYVIPAVAGAPFIAELSGIAQLRRFRSAGKTGEGNLP